MSIIGNILALYHRHMRPPNSLRSLPPKGALLPFGRPGGQ
jgi:hypothetical protein